MDKLLRFFGIGKKERELPARIPSDTVIPIPYFNQLGVYRNLIPVCVFVFNDRLDAIKLHDSLERLLSRPGWRRLGGRLRKAPGSEALEYHVPEEFTEKRPAVQFSHERFDVSMAEHPLASRLPRPSPTPGTDRSQVPRPEIITIDGGLRELDPLLLRPTQPRNLDGYLYSDLPSLSLHVVSFTDGTFVSLAWQHVLSDAMGIKALLDAWTLVLAGRDDEVRELVEADPMDKLGLAPIPPSFPLAAKLVKGWRFTLWILRILFDGWRWKKAGKARFIVRIPDQCVQKLRQEAMARPVAQGSTVALGAGGQNRNPAFVSAGDILTAWCISLTALRRPLGSERKFTVGNVLSVRKRVPNFYDSSRLALVRNATLSAWSFITVRDVTQGSKTGKINKDGLFAVARTLRRDLTEQTTPEAIEHHCALERIGRGSVGSGGAQYGDLSTIPTMMSNWEAARYYDVDFSSAVIGRSKQTESDDSKQSLTGRPTYFQSWMAHDIPEVGFIGSYNILGVDGNRNYWLMAAIDGITNDTVREGLGVFTD